jgi:hypothetical protein
VHILNFALVKPSRNTHTDVFFFVLHSAYEMARKMAAQGVEMLPPDGWESQHTLAFQLHIGSGIPSAFTFLVFCSMGASYSLLLRRTSAMRVPVQEHGDGTTAVR